MAVRKILGGFILAAGMLVGCSNGEATAPNGGLDGQGTSATDKMGSTTGGSSTTGGNTTTATGPVACTTAQSWKANNDFRFDNSSGSQTFAQTINGMIRKSNVSPFAV